MSLVKYRRSNTRLLYIIIVIIAGSSFYYGYSGPGIPYPVHVSSPLSVCGIVMAFDRISIGLGRIRVKSRENEILFHSFFFSSVFTSVDLFSVSLMWSADRSLFYQYAYISITGSYFPGGFVAYKYPIIGINVLKRWTVLYRGRAAIATKKFGRSKRWRWFSWRAESYDKSLRIKKF